MSLRDRERERKRKYHGMEKMLFGCDSGSPRFSDNGWLSWMVVAQCPY